MRHRFSCVKERYRARGWTESRVPGAAAAVRLSGQRKGTGRPGPHRASGADGHQDGELASPTRNEQADQGDNRSDDYPGSGLLGDTGVDGDVQGQLDAGKHTKNCPIRRREGADYSAACCTNSINTPPESFGWVKLIRDPAVPVFGSSYSSRTPADRRWSLTASMSVTVYAIC